MLTAEEIIDANTHQRAVASRRNYLPQREVQIFEFCNRYRVEATYFGDNDPAHLRDGLLVDITPEDLTLFSDLDRRKIWYVSKEF